MSEIEIISIVIDGQVGAVHRRASGPRRDVAVVICPVLGRDARTAYRSLFFWANALAESGFDVLRYDARGGGDSLDLDADSDAWTQWVRGVEQASEFMRTFTGASRLCLAGLRIGGALAMTASQTVKPEYLILLAPVVSGPTWLRELEFGAAIRESEASNNGCLEIDGLRLSSETMEAVSKVDLTTLPLAWNSALLATSPMEKRLAKALGPDHQVTGFPGWNKLFRDSHVNEIPRQVLGVATKWLEDREAPRGVNKKPRRAPPARQSLQHADWVEEPVSIEGGLRGILSLPTRDRSRKAVIFGNTAADPRAGTGNFTTRASRALAAAGIATLRFDFSGVGESPDCSHGRPHVYETSRRHELRRAAALLQRRGFDDITLAGVCSGGFHALRAILEDGFFTKGIAFNSFFVWRPGPLDYGAQAYAMRSSRMRGVACRALRLKRIWPAIVRRASAVWETSTRWFLDSYLQALRREIHEASKRDLRFRVVVGRRDYAMTALAANFGRRGQWLSRRPGFSVSVLDGLDHSLISATGQAMALREIFDFLEYCPVPAAVGAQDALASRACDGGPIVMAT